MGAAGAVNTTVNYMLTSITQSLKQSVNASATANCNVTIGSISFTETNGCSITVSNMCSASSSGVLNATLEGVFKAYDQFDSSTKQESAQLLSATFSVNTTVNNIKKDFSTYVEQNCGATSNLNQNITIQNISLGKCSAPGNTPLELKFVNTGSADANCAIGLVQKLLVAASNQVSVSNEQTNSYGVLVLGVVALGGIFGSLVYLWYAKRIFSISTDDKIKLQWAKNEVLPWPLEIELFNRI